MLRSHIQITTSYFELPIIFYLYRSLSSRVRTEHTLTHIHLTVIRKHLAVQDILSLSICNLALYLFGPSMIVRKFCLDGRPAAGTVTRKIRGRSVTRFFLPKTRMTLYTPRATKEKIISSPFVVPFGPPTIKTQCTSEIILQ